jgi:ZIP family zinc transporter
MVEAGFWGLVAGLALVIGALVGMFAHASQRMIGTIMAFGAGVLISAVAFELSQEAFRVGGHDAFAVGMAAGALTFFLGDLALDHRGGNHRKRSGGQQSEGSGGAIVLGAMLDGIPESIAIGVSLAGGGGVGVSIVAAVFLSNVPESLSAATGLAKAGHSRRFIIGLWLGVALLSALAAALGYLLLADASGNVIGAIQSFAAGAILVMLADTMMPEAFEEGGSLVGLATALGFSLAFLLSTFE